MTVELPVAAPSQVLPGPGVPHAASDSGWLMRVEGLGKCYRIYDQPADRLKQMLLSRFGRRYGREFWALRGLSLELRQGETLGILGRNGSGKSTLLQLLAGTLAPTTGRLERRGRVAALLELGSGFNPEFTGRENVLINAAVLGLSEAEVRLRFDEIVAFADIGEFLDQPVRFYSSGMLMRLAFAVSTAVDPDVLLLDEALAVGDVFFRQKCYQRLEQLRQRGVAIVLVSHVAHEVEQYCQRAVLLDHGLPVFEGPAREAVKRYYLQEQRARLAAAAPAAATPPPEPAAEAPLPALDRVPWPEAEAFYDVDDRPQVADGQARCTAVALCDQRGAALRHVAQGGVGVFCCEFEALADLEVPVGGLMIYSERGVSVHGKHTLQYDCPVPLRVPRGTRLRFRHEIALQLSPQEYTFEVTLSSLSREVYERRASHAAADLYAHIGQVCAVPRAGSFSVGLRPVGTRPIQILHHGLANLPGRCAVAALAPEEE